MKKIITAIAILISGHLFAAKNCEIKYKNDNYQDTLITYLTSLNLPNFIGVSIDSFLIHLPTNYSQIKILPGDNLKNAHMLYIRYNANVYVGIIVSNFQFMNPAPPKSNWSIPLFRKEHVSFIEIYNDTTCINGCQ